MRGFSPFKADRGHFHHQLLEKGFSPLQVTFFISMISLLMGFIGLVGEKFSVPEGAMFGGFLLCFGLYSLALKRLFS
jgi:UDP-GlcNAc:undecaprenyl-phosphate GlcNAc-1-phosphate transferase